MQLPSIPEWEPIPRPLPPKHPLTTNSIGPPNALAPEAIITIPLTSSYKYNELGEGEGGSNFGGRRKKVNTVSRKREEKGFQLVSAQGRPSVGNPSLLHK